MILNHKLTTNDNRDRCGHHRIVKKNHSYLTVQRLRRINNRNNMNRLDCAETPDHSEYPSVCIVETRDLKQCWTISRESHFTGALGWMLVVVLSTPPPPRLGRVISDLFRLLHVVRYGTEALVYRNYPRESVDSKCLAIIFGRIASDVPWLLHSTAGPMKFLHRCRH